jgi:hypothetical protein
VNAPAESAAAPTPGPPDAPQRIIKVRRDYNSWVGSETMEDYALRFTPQRFRKWSEWRVANTAFGVASFLVLEAVGATLLVTYGFTNAALAILVTGLIIFLAGLPISVYAARSSTRPSPSSSSPWRPPSWPTRWSWRWTSRPPGATSSARWW